MNYFEKIEAYKNGNLSKIERLVFEEALAENLSLQEEVAAYELGQDLFSFVGGTLSEEEITSPEATATADLLINFAANTLSETEILATDSSATNTAIIRPLKNKRTNKKTWLVAASMLLMLSLIGSQFYMSQQRPLGQSVVENKLTKPVFKAPSNSIILPENNAPKQEIIARERLVSKNINKVEKVKKNAIQKMSSLAENGSRKTTVPLSPRTEMPILEPLVTNITAQKITTGKVIDSGESVVYQGDNGVTLKPGFHAKAGANFVAMATTKTNFIANEVLESKQSVVYKASQTITLKPGFHAKSGIDFTAKANAGTEKELSTNVVISSNEEVVYKAENTITLKPGFHAKAGAAFVATVAGE